MMISTTKRLLLIEDNHVDALTALSCIQNVDEKWEVTECQTLLEALNALDQQSYELILLDLGLPDSEHLEGLEAITKRVQAVPVIIITGNDNNDVAMEALKKGAQDYIVKGSYSIESLQRSMRYAMERKKHENRIREMTIALDSEQRSNHMQSSFLSMISHQFRTPLAVISGSQSMLKSAIEQNDHDKIQQELTRTEQALGRITELIDSATNLCDIESGSMHFNLAAFPFKAMLESLWERYSNICQGRSMILSMDDAPSYIVGDPYLLHTALIQIINNAIRYSEPDSPVRLDAFIEDSALCVHITDSGRGIAAEDVGRIFDRFYRTDNDNTGPQGVGLGLSLVQNIIELHQGTIDVESELDTGTTIKLEIPLHMMSCLVVDDNLLNRSVAAQCLRSLGFDVAETSSPIDGLGMVREDAVNFILLDWHMPNLNGLEFIKLTRDSGRRVPIFLYSAIEDNGREIALQYGADDFVPKPFTKEKLQSVLQEHNLLSHTIDLNNFTPPTQECA